MAMTFSEILNILLGGGLIATLLGLITLKAAVRKANAEASQALAQAKKAEAEAETVRITNTENATRILVENIVKPLKEELNATREDLQATKKEMASTKRAMSRLTKAVESANNCRHADYCPVLIKLRDIPKDSDDGDSDRAGGRDTRHSIGRNKTGGARDGPDEQDGDVNPGGQHSQTT